MTPGSQSAAMYLVDDEVDDVGATTEALIPDLYDVIRADIASQREERVRAAAADRLADGVTDGAWMGRFDHLADTPVTGI